MELTEAERDVVLQYVRYGRLERPPGGQGLGAASAARPEVGPTVCKRPRLGGDPWEWWRNLDELELRNMLPYSPAGAWADGLTDNRPAKPGESACMY